MAIGKYFSERELACKHCGVNKCTQELCDVLDAFREAVGKPVIVDDAYRCPVHNAAVGGAPNSQHMLGEAADIKVDVMSAAQLEAVAEKIPAIHGIGRGDYQAYIHVDVREKPARWCYNENGAEVPYYAPHEVNT